MARKRYVSSGMGLDEDVVDIATEKGIDLALMWPWFIPAFDDWGRIEITSPRQVKLDVFNSIPVNAKQVANAIEAYSSYGLVFRYKVNSRIYLAIEPCKFYKYQTYIDKAKRCKDASNCPSPVDPPWKECVNCLREMARPSAEERAGAPEMPLSVPSPSPSPIKDIDINNINKADETNIFGIDISLEQHASLLKKAPDSRGSALWLNHFICELKRMKSEGYQSENDFLEILKLIEEEGKKKEG